MESSVITTVDDGSSIKYSVKLGRLVVNDVRETREKTTNANRVNNPLKCSVTSSATPASFNVPQ